MFAIHLPVYVFHVYWYERVFLVYFSQWDMGMEYLNTTCWEWVGAWMIHHLTLFLQEQKDIK